MIAGKLSNDIHIGRFLIICLRSSLSAYFINISFFLSRGLGASAHSQGAVRSTFYYIFCFGVGFTFFYIYRYLWIRPQDKCQDFNLFSNIQYFLSLFGFGIPSEIFLLLSINTFPFTSRL